MAIVDTWDLKYEVEAEYPYSTHMCATEQAAIKAVAFEKNVHNVDCRVRVVGQWTSSREASISVPVDALGPKGGIYG